MRAHADPQIDEFLLEHEKAEPQSQEPTTPIPPVRNNTTLEWACSY
jgi:hypothetical protein